VTLAAVAFVWFLHYWNWLGGVLVETFKAGGDDIILPPNKRKSHINLKFFQRNLQMLSTNYENHERKTNEYKTICPVRKCSLRLCLRLRWRSLADDPYYSNLTNAVSELVCGSRLTALAWNGTPLDFFSWAR